MRTLAIPALVCLLVPTISPAQTKPHAAIATTKPPAPSTADELPITRVSLYKNGIGFFEHTGRVTGDQTVTIAFTTAQLNDVLQSLTAIDRNGGRIAGADYNSTTPLDQQLKSLPFALGQDGSAVTAADFYAAVRGARVEVTGIVGVTGAGPTLTGRLLDLEMRDTTQPAGDSTATIQKPFLTVISDTGAVRTFELTGATQVRLLDTTLHTDVNHYLELLDANRNQGLRRLTLTDIGSGTRSLQVSYLSEVPIWKSTYRILFTDASAAAHASLTQTTTQTATLQGWSVIDNTTGSDWINVQLSLIAGSPQSFIQPLSIPYYGRRPQIPLPQEAQLTPQTHESGELISHDGPPPSAEAAGMADSNGGPRMAGMGGGNGVPGGIMGGMGTSPFAQQKGHLNRFAAPIPYETTAADSIAPNTTTRAFDDYFAYNLTQPITIRRNQSALVPILQTKLDAERVTLWSPQQPQALRALWITNTSNLTLDRGSFTIVEDGSFAGEGLLDPIHPAERRLLSYAADQAVRVTVDHRNDTHRVQHLTISKGVLKETTADIAEIEYLVHNAAPEPRMVVVEHPARPGWTIDSDPRPFESTPTVHRFRVATQPGETVRLHIGERHTLNQLYRLTDTTDDQLALLLKNANAGPAVLQQLEPVFQAKRAVVALDQQIAAKQQSLADINQDQSRLRDNLTALKSTPDAEARPLAKRYTDELLQQEDTLSALRKDLDALNQQRQSAQQDLSNKIDALTLDEPL